MNKHSSCDLAQMQSLPLKYKIIMTKQRIKAWYDYWDGNVYVSISGGKDSQVLAHIVKEMYPDVPLVFVNTGLEYDSVMLKGMELADEVLRPSMDFVSVVTKYGYPIISKPVANTVHGAKKGTTRYEKINGTFVDPKTGKLSQYNYKKYKFLLNAPFRISDQCCDELKKKTAFQYYKKHKSYPFIGMLAEESKKRKDAWIKTGCNAFEKKKPQSQPLAFWTEQDILHYIKQYGLQIAEIYGDICYQDEDGMYYDNPLFNDSMKLTTTGVKRTGCIFCMFGITQDTERFLRLKESEPKKYDYVMRGGKFDNEGMWIPHNGLGYKFVIDWLNEYGGLDIKY